MDNIAKNEKEMENLIHAVRIYSQDIWMEFCIEKCVILVMKSGKGHVTVGVELPSQGKIRKVGENQTYKYLGIVEAETIKQVETEEKNEKATGDKTI